MSTLSQDRECPVRPLGSVTRASLEAASQAAPGPRPAARSHTAIYLAFAAIYIIWGSTYLGIRIAIESMPPFLMAAARFIAAGSILFAVLKFRGARWPTA